MKDTIGDKDAKCTSEARLDGKTVIVTGSSSGIGIETARDMANRGARVIFAVRNLEKAKPVVEDIKTTTGNDNLQIMKLDLCSLKSVLDFVKEFKSNESRLDILINNAGIMLQPKVMTGDGFEQVWQANYLGHFLLTVQLLDILKQSAPSRIVNVSSKAHDEAKKINFDDINGDKKYDHLEMYGQSKLAQILFTRKLDRILEGTGVTAYCLHPGVVRTNLLSEGAGLPTFSMAKVITVVGNFGMNAFCLGLTPVEGAQTSIYCAVTEGLESKSGKYFVNCKEKEPTRWALDDEMGDKLWEFSYEQIKPFVEEM